jgi:hypothetical protein
MMNARSALSGLKHQKEKRNMDYFAGLDVSVKETSICIVDDAGKIVREARVASEPEALLQVLTNPMMEGQVVDSLKALDPDGRLEKRSYAEVPKGRHRTSVPDPFGGNFAWS